MNWTRNKPTAPGWYWAREDFHNGNFSTPEVVNVSQDHEGQLWVLTYEEDENDEGCLQTYETFTEVNLCKFSLWAGPLETPGKEVPS